MPRPDAPTISTLRFKSGNTSSAGFTGTPKKTTVLFTSSFANNNYAVTVTGDDARTWTIENKVSSSFVINSNSDVELTGVTYWIAASYGEM